MAGQTESLLALPLLVASIFADHTNGTVAPDYLAVTTDFFDGCTNFHLISPKICSEGILNNRRTKRPFIAASHPQVF
jgi:hypothetical protein